VLRAAKDSSGARFEPIGARRLYRRPPGKVSLRAPA